MALLAELNRGAFEALLIRLSRVGLKARDVDSLRRAVNAERKNPQDKRTPQNGNDDENEEDDKDEGRVKKLADAIVVWGENNFAQDAGGKLYHYHSVASIGPMEQPTSSSE